METYTKKGNMILLGDFSARTGMYKDNVSKEGSNFISNDSSELSLERDLRNNFDNILNSHGKRLLETCKIFDLRILNGRSKGDYLGNTTYHGKNGI